MTESQSVLIFGASRGIGAAAAELFHERGHRVAGTHRGSGVPTGVSPIEADITNSDSITAAFKAAEEINGPVETLIIASGITKDRLLMRMSEEDLRAVFETNAFGPMLAAKAALRPMLKNRRGSMVFVSSMSAKYGVPGQTNYTASKGAIEAFARSLAREHAAQGIRVNVVAPGATDTDMMAAVPDAERSAMLAQVPMGRLGSASEVAQVIFDVSQATFMTGATVPVAGGI